MSDDKLSAIADPVVAKIFGAERSIVDRGIEAGNLIISTEGSK
jgi:hypothetical protein